MSMTRYQAQIFDRLRTLPTASMSITAMAAHCNINGAYLYSLRTKNPYIGREVQRVRNTAARGKRRIVSARRTAIEVIESCPCIDCPLEATCKEQALACSVFAHWVSTARIVKGARSPDAATYERIYNAEDAA